MQFNVKEYLKTRRINTEKAFILINDANLTGKSLLEAQFASTNPQYNDRLFIELRVQYMKIATSEHVVYTNCFMY